MKRTLISTKTAFLTGIILLIASCGKEHAPEVAREFQTKNIIIVVIDGPRFSETWGDPTHQYIPNFANKLAPIGVVNGNFNNLGVTKTNPGHTAITTGYYEAIENRGEELPTRPSIFHYWLKETGKPSDSAWVITGKDKLEVLAYTSDSKWANGTNPSTDCGKNGLGLGSGFRNDMLTFERTKEILAEYHPQLVLISLLKPDSAGHDDEWDNYLIGIQEADAYVSELWDFLQVDSRYRDKTALFITNDHGRHLDDVADGFISHGDDCEGCRHINFIALGPDFKNGVVDKKPRELIDISATISKILGFEMPTSDGDVMEELFLTETNLR